MHSIFKDDAFGARLIEQLVGKLESISTNWREDHCMETLITLINRLRTLASSQSVIFAASNLLEKARKITDGWIKALRLEIEKAVDLNTVNRNSFYTLASSLLCRRTFETIADEGRMLGPA